MLIFLDTFEDKMEDRFIDDLFDESGVKMAPGFGIRLKGKMYRDLPRKYQWQIMYERNNWNEKSSGEQSLKEMIEEIKKSPSEKISFYLSRSSQIDEQNIGEIAESLFEFFNQNDNKENFNTQWSESKLVIKGADAMTPEQCCLLALVFEAYHVCYEFE